jgi:hypothetical protein
MRICFIGDSLVNGVGDPTGLGWVGRVATAARRRGHDITAYNLGIRRDTSGDIAVRWQGRRRGACPRKSTDGSSSASAATIAWRSTAVRASRRRNRSAMPVPSWARRKPGIRR